MTKFIRISIADKNDNPPYFDKHLYEAEVDEMWAAETQRRAEMLDTGEAGTLSWGEIERRFAERRSLRDA